MSVLLPNKGTNDIKNRNIVPNADVIDCNSTCNPKSHVQRLRKISPRTIANWRFILAFVVAVLADVILTAFALIEPLEIVADTMVALILCSILGFNWVYVPALLIEAVPALNIFPTWTLAVLVLAGIKVMKHK